MPSCVWQRTVAFALLLQLTASLMMH